MRRVDAIGADGRARAPASPRPASGTAGPASRSAPSFDGWGYAHLFDAKTGEELDTYAIPESQDPRFAVGFGDLSIHEFATDPTTNLAYSVLLRRRHAGVPVQPRRGLEPTGTWIDAAAARTSGASSSSRPPTASGLIAGSDRDFGLVILRYTGRGRSGRRRPPTPPGPARAERRAGGAARPTRGCGCASGRSSWARTAASGSRSTARRRPAGVRRHAARRDGSDGPDQEALPGDRRHVPQRQRAAVQVAYRTLAPQAAEPEGDGLGAHARRGQDAALREHAGDAEGQALARSGHTS